MNNLLQMDEVIVSVIMPVFNCENFLKESIESILNQTFKNFELIIINDGSTDNSEKIIEQYSLKDDRIKFINRSINKKIVYTLNEGLKCARGKYIARMDADDIAYQNRLLAQVEYLNKHTDVYALGTSYTVFNEQGYKKRAGNNYPFIYLGFKFLSNTYLCHPSVMFKKECIEEIGVYKETEAEDFELFSRFTQKFKCANLKTSYLLYREHINNRSLNYSDTIKKSVYRTFENNYTFYIKDKNFREKFFHFHTNMSGNIFNIPKYIYHSICIQNKIRKNYNIPFFSKEFYNSLKLFMSESSYLFLIKCKMIFIKNNG